MQSLDYIALGFPDSGPVLYVEVMSVSLAYVKTFKQLCFEVMNVFLVYVGTLF